MIKKITGVFGWFKSNWIKTTLTVVFIGVMIYWFNQGITGVFDTTKVERRNLAQEVNITGRVKAAESVDLVFEQGGRIAKMAVKVGEEVGVGEKLAELVNAEAYSQVEKVLAEADGARAELRRVEALLESERITLTELEKGARAEDINIKESALRKAEQDLKNYYNNISNVIGDAYIKADDILNVKLADVFVVSSGGNYDLSYVSSFTQAELNAKNYRRVVEQEFSAWRGKISALHNMTENELEESLNDSLDYLASLQYLLEQVRESLVLVSDSKGMSIETFRSNMSTALTTTVSAMGSLRTTLNNIASQKEVVSQAKDSLALTLAPATTEQINNQKSRIEQAEASVEAAKARVRQAEAQIESARSALRRTQIIAPFSGLITKVNYRSEEVVPANVPVVSLISRDVLQIESYIQEADIAKIEVGDKADITLDAYTDRDIFTADIIAVDLAETIIDGVPTYKTTFQFMETDEKIKPGMTANIDIITDWRENVLVIPRRAIIDRGLAGTFVNVPSGDGEYVERPVTVGLYGSDGYVEVLSGLAENEEIITFIR